MIKRLVLAGVVVASSLVSFQLSATKSAVRLKAPTPAVACHPGDLFGDRGEQDDCPCTVVYPDERSDTYCPPEK